MKQELDRKAEEARQKEAEQSKLRSKLKTSFFLKTADGKFSVLAFLLDSNQKHVKIKRSDNGKEIVVERSLLDISTLQKIRKKEELKRQLNLLFFQIV